VDTTIGVSLISSGAAIIVALIGAWSASGRAVAAAVAPLNQKIGEQEITIGEQAVTIQHLTEKLEMKGETHDL
jgi:adenosylmethionine-8-amino-7-oxononanoate aminotransferase